MPGQDNPTPVAAYDAKGITFNANFDDLIVEDPNEPSPDIDETDDPVVIEKSDSDAESITPSISDQASDPVSDQVKEEEEEETEEKEEESPTNEYEDYTDIALIALKKVRSGEWEGLEEKDIPRDMDALLFDELVVKNDELKYERYKDTILNQVGEYANYVKFLIEGGDPQALQDALQFSDFSSLDPTKEKDQEKLITEFYKQRGVPEEDIPDIVENIMDRGKGEERAIEAQKTFNQYEKQVLENDKKRREAAIQAQEEAMKQYRESVKKVIDSGEVAGYKLNKKQSREVYDAMFEPTEIIQVPGQDGRMINQKTTRANKLFTQVNSDPEKQVALVLWLLEGGKFDFAKEQAETETANSLKDLLARRSKSTKRSTSPKRKTENAFDRIAERVAQFDFK